MVSIQYLSAAVVIIILIGLCIVIHFFLLLYFKLSVVNVPHSLLYLLISVLLDTKQELYLLNGLKWPV